MFYAIYDWNAISQTCVVGNDETGDSSAWIVENLVNDVTAFVETRLCDECQKRYDTLNDRDHETKSRASEKSQAGVNDMRD